MTLKEKGHGSVSRGNTEDNYHGESSMADHYRGHQIWFDDSTEVWRYTDDNSPVQGNWENRPCGKCGEMFTTDGHDPCIANLPGVMNACCGHGNENEAYIQFDGGETIHGLAATQCQRSMTDRRRP